MVTEKADLATGAAGRRRIGRRHGDSDDVVLSRGNRFLIYGAGQNTNFWVRYFQRRPELAEWHLSYRASGVLLVAVFDRLGLFEFDDALPF